MIAAIIVLTAMAALLAVVFANMRSSESPDSAVIDKINGLLPQTQCGRCTFAGCRPYATALASGEADINQCPPGGDRTAQALARLLGRPAKPVDPQYGVVHSSPLVAWIDEPACIGCAKCIQACPVDAIVGASKFMHTVIAAQCTGCELCVAPCPVDCIEMRPLGNAAREVRLRAS
jgi:electron transport complex protein RnfB